jgi:hypothetical protein
MVREANNFRQRLYPVEQLGLPSRPRFERHPRSSPRYAVRVAERDLECEVGLAEGLWPAGSTDEGLRSSGSIRSCGESSAVDQR